MTQGTILFDTPLSVLRAEEQLERVRQLMIEDITNKETLALHLEAATKQVQVRRDELINVEISYVIDCCNALEELMVQEGRGWCPICQILVPFEGFYSGYTQNSIHVPEHWTGSEYTQAFHEACNETTIEYFRVPHYCHNDNFEKVDKPFERIPLEYNTHARYGRSIAEAPAELFSAYGIAPIDQELLKRVSLDASSFLPRSVWPSSLVLYGW